jgi:hypothetical protein
VGTFSRILTGFALAAALIRPATALAATPTPIAAPAPPATIESALSAVACPSDTSCFAVGSSLGDDHHRRALIERWDGTRWTIARPAPTPGLRTVFLFSVSCATPRSCMAIGNALRARRTLTSVTEHWNGTRWRLEPTPPAGEPRPGQGLLAVSCPSANGCVAVGNYVKATVIERWNGRRWRVSARLPAHGDEYVGLQDVSCPSTSFCLAVGFREPINEQFALAYDDSRWSVAPTSGGGETSLQQASCFSSTFCLAVGAAFSGDAASAVAARWNGRRLTDVPYEAPPESGATALSRVSCTSQLSCLALGAFGAGDPSQEMGQSWDGSRLALAFTAARPGPFPWSSVNCRPTFCMLVGGAGRRVETARITLEKPAGS